MTRTEILNEVFHNNLSKDQRHAALLELVHLQLIYCQPKQRAAEQLKDG
jgi:hypothetical protein